MPIKITTRGVRTVRTSSCPTYEDAFTATANHLRELERSGVPTATVRVLILVGDLDRQMPEESGS